MKCPTCGTAELVADTRDIPYTYKGQATIIKDVTGEYCTNCDEVLLNIAESYGVMVEMAEFRGVVDDEIQSNQE